METMKELVALQKPIMLDEGNFGHWKARMRHIIRGIDEDAWTAVEQGWTAPTMVMDDKSMGPLPKERWTDSDKAASKFNSKALTTIFSAVDLDQFKIIQGCESAKEAWDTLINHFEGNTSVRRTRIDHLASKFENLRMEDDESIGSFISKISSIANEASVLGKKYNEKKLVKKVLRCLPPRFEAYKAVLKIAINTDEMKFDQLAGILKVHDLERAEGLPKEQKGIAFTADNKEIDRVKRIEDNMSLMAKNFNKMLKRVEKGQNRSSNRFQSRDSDRSNVRNDSGRGNRKKELQCHECEGYGHYRNECPLTKRKELKCIECKGYGHTRSECPNNLKKDKSLICFSDTESEEGSDNEELLMNFVALVGQDDACETISMTDSESEIEPEGDNSDLKSEYRLLFDKFTELSLENLQLIKDRAMLKAQVNILELEQPAKDDEVTPVNTENREKEKRDSLEKTISDQAHSLKSLETRYDQTKLLLNEELEKSRLLQYELSENYKKVRMLNTGSDKLDHILRVGQSPATCRGLGYQGYCSQSKDLTQGVTFVKGSQQTSSSIPQTVGSVNPTATKSFNVPSTKRKNGCMFCCKAGHKASNCYFMRNQLQRAWRTSRCFMEPSKVGHVWIAKTDLYPKYGNRVSPLRINADETTGSGPELTPISDQREGKAIMCNLAFIRDWEPSDEVAVSHHKDEMSLPQNCDPLLEDMSNKMIVGNVAYTSTDSAKQTDLPWYFDSGCSRHMTGTLECLENVEEIQGGKVTFGDGGQGKILGVGLTDRADLPRLINVFYVEGLKANLISVSQLCDEGLQVIFDRKECRAVNDRGDLVLCGYRSGNNCYMWKPSSQCLTAKESQTELWHKKLGANSFTFDYPLLYQEMIK
ncbi:uncharacterized protein LOC106417262 [Brassica napus]|uniref:uncharacterized protein LOC106417262 n=1 Tax=Brassica napus TaxID=3708 RepID=UPI002078BBB6|nr:uncharacterized protein LOC106417262 [Brassica napus]